MQQGTERRRSTIRRRMRMVVAIPMTLLLLVWLGVGTYVFHRALVQWAGANTSTEVLVPSAMALTAVMDERSASASYLERPEDHGESLEAARAAVDEQVDSVRGSFQDVSGFVDDAVHEHMERLEENLAAVTDIRSRVDDGNINRESLLDRYTEVIEAGADLFEAQARAGSTPETMSAALSGTQLFRAVDSLSTADARLSQVLVEGELSLADQTRFTEHMGAFHTQFHTVYPQLGAEQTQRAREITLTDSWRRLRTMERQIINREVEMEVEQFTGEVIPDYSLALDPEQWDENFGEVRAALMELAGEQAGYAADLAQDNADRSMLLAAGTTAALLALFAVAFVPAGRIGFGIARQLQELRGHTQELAENRLPAIMRRLGDGERVNLDKELPEPSQPDDDIGDVARAFASAQRAAVAAAVGQSDIRHGVNRLFVSVAHRSQALAHRQLKLLDTMEKDEEDPRRLRDLFQLDHLATRSRRYAENLLLLGGEHVGSGAAGPVRLVDVVRAAISASGDYSRITRRGIASVEVLGLAAPDLIHLLSELMDNAVNFSPPHTSVVVSAEAASGGVAVEVEDRGIGMTEEELRKANAMLAKAPEFDVLHVQQEFRLGLFAVSRLAARHGIRVTLRRSPYGGVQAIVLVPRALCAGSPDGHDEPGRTAFAAGAAGPSSPPPLQTGLPPEQQSAGLAVEDERDALPDEATGKPGQPAATGTRATASGASPRFASATPAEGAGEGEEGRPALPRRTPQTHLAPELARESGPHNGEASTPAASTAEDPAADPPGHQERLDALRRSFSAFQSGTQRGRVQASDQPQHREED